MLLGSPCTRYGVPLQTDLHTNHPDERMVPVVRGTRGVEGPAQAPGLAPGAARAGSCRPDDTAEDARRATVRQLHLVVEVGARRPDAMAGPDARACRSRSRMQLRRLLLWRGRVMPTG